MGEKLVFLRRITTQNSMKKSCCLTLFAVALLVPICPLFAQNTTGTDFWVTFMPNGYEDSFNPGKSLDLTMTSPRPCTGTVSNPQTGWSVDFEVPACEAITVNIPWEMGHFEEASDTILHNGFHVVSTDDISLFVSNYREYSADVALVLPTPLLGSDYVTAMYPHPGSGPGIPHVRTEFSVVAVEDKTWVELSLTCDSQNGHVANEPFSVLLNAGECYQVQSVQWGDLSGSQVTALGGKRVAVFAGNRMADIPFYYNTADMVFEQMQPLENWGRRFVVTGSLERGVDRVRVTAQNDYCDIYIDGERGETLGARETYEFEITSENPVVYIETSQPALTVLYQVGYEYDHPSNLTGDPSMVIIPPLEEAVQNAVFPVFTDWHCEMFFLNIVTETSAISDIRLNGDVYASQFHEVPGNPSYSYARIEISPTLAGQMLSSQSGHFVAHTYGMGTCESYAFSVGANYSDPLSVGHSFGPMSIGSFPNPGKDVLNICADVAVGQPYNARVEIYDLNGRLMHSQALTGNVTIVDAATWPSGTYVWKVVSTGSTTVVETGKWIKE